MVLSYFLILVPLDTLELEIVFIYGLQLSNYKEAYWKIWIAGKKDTNGIEVIWPIT